jgi:DNA-binding NarL/FixJ family response regulator
MAVAPVGPAYSRVSSTLDCAPRISSSIRVVVGEIPRLLRDIIENAITQEPDMMLVEAAGADLATLVRRSGADVAIVADDPLDCDTRHTEALVEHPNLKILVLADNGREAHLLEFRRGLMPDISPRALVDVIRAVRQ